MAVGVPAPVSDGRVLVLGASSQIGLFALPRLAALGLRVTAVARSRPPAWYPDLPQVSWLWGEGQAAADNDATRLLVTGPLGLVRGWLPALPRLQRVVAFSTTSVESKAGSPDPAERRQVEQIAGEERFLADACARLGLGACILRPTLVYGCGMDRNLSTIARWIERRGIVPVVRGATGLRQPVHADDLAGTAVTALMGSGEGRFNLCGGTTLAYRDMVERIFVALGRRPRLLELPAPLLAAALTLARVVPAYRELRPAMVRRQRQDLVFDDQPARELWSHRPRPFRPAAQDFQPPPGALLRDMANPAG